MSEIRYIELLAPARDYQTALDAINAGADAIYIGAGKYGARYAASNSVEDIARIVRYAHCFGVRVYVTLNTVLYDNELEDAREIALSLKDVGVDAIIVQDMAYCRMDLGMELHASTQTSIVDERKARFFSDAGFSRIVLERSLSLEEIKKIKASTDAQLEVFIHGALCVSQSGKCFLSRSMSSRSGNRGECSQPCRLTYDLLDASGKKIMEKKHILSLGDLNLSSSVDELVKAGVSSFKIEGRLKDRVYVRNIVSYYNSLLNSIIEKNPSYSRSSCGKVINDVVSSPLKSFSRMQTEYYLHGRVPGAACFATAKALGEKVGECQKVIGNRVYYTPYRNVVLSSGDGLCYITRDGTEGLNVNSVGQGVFESNQRKNIVPGTVLYRNYDHKFSSSILSQRMRRELSISLCLKMGESQLVLKAVYEKIQVQKSVSGQWEMAHNPERQKGLCSDVLSRSGDSEFEVKEVIFDGDIRFIPSSTLTALRRETLDLLREEIILHHKKPLPFRENKAVVYPENTVYPYDNVTNHLSYEFYTDHGVKTIENGYDKELPEEGSRVMCTHYCIRREIGECLLKGSKLKEPLFLEHGIHRYRLHFDCRNCQMMLFNCLKKNISRE